MTAGGDNVQKPKRTWYLPWRLFFSQWISLTLLGMLAGVLVGFGYGLFFLVMGACTGAPLGALIGAISGAITGLVFNAITIGWYYPLRSQAQADRYRRLVPAPCALVAAIACILVGIPLTSLWLIHTLDKRSIGLALLLIVPAICAYLLAASTLRKMTHWYVQGYPFTTE